MGSQHQSSSDGQFHSSTQSWVHSSNQPLSLWAVQHESSSGMLFHLAIQSLAAHSSNHPGGEPAAVGEFLTKQLPAILNKCMAFHTAQLSTSPETVQVRVQHGPNPPFFRCHPAPQFLWCWCPQSQWMCTASVCLPLHLYFLQQLPASKSLLMLGSPPCSGRGGNW